MANKKGVHDNKGSIFTMDHVRHISSLKDHSEAKKYAHDIVDNHPTALSANKDKAKKMIDSTKNSGHLALGMSNFILSHGGLKVMKTDEEINTLIKNLNEIKEMLVKFDNFESQGGMPEPGSVNEIQKGVLSEPKKPMVIKVEKINYDKNGQWSLDKNLDGDGEEVLTDIEDGRESKYMHSRKNSKTGEPVKEEGIQFPDVPKDA